MKIEVKLRDDEKWETPIAFAEAVIEHWMGECYDPGAASFQRKGMGEMVEYLRVFCDSHPTYEYKEETCRSTMLGN